MTPPPIRILDRHCGKCHQGDGKGRKKLDMTLRPSKDAGFFPEPYVTLTLGAKRVIGGPFPSKKCEGGIAGTLLPQLSPARPGDNQTVPPMTSLSYKSKLIDIAMSGKHNDVKVDPVSLRKLIVWVDTLCPYLGEKEVRAMPDPDPEKYLKRRWPYPPRMKTAPVVNRAYAQDEFRTQEDRLDGAVAKCLTKPQVK